jgi:4-diphosphocytidyl-2-C-methyl-D-erythritol kinase
VLLDWCDTLHFESRADGRLQRHDLTTPLPADDLCLRAARALQAASGTTVGADISIDKQIPSGAGMGGGSSDAASTLLALNRLWGLGWPAERLRALGVTLGADVPFFVGGHNAFVEGIGDQLTAVAVPRQWLAVLKPTVGIETQAIFSSASLVRDSDAVILSGFLADPARWLDFTVEGFGRNDLEPVAKAFCPDVAKASRLLQNQFGNSRMTGSGSAVFARSGTGDRPMTTLPTELPSGWVARMCRSLESHPLSGWAPD